jgi:hypothetical protein
MAVVTNQTRDQFAIPKNSIPINQFTKKKENNITAKLIAHLTI